MNLHMLRLTIKLLCSCLKLKNVLLPFQEFVCASVKYKKLRKILHKFTKAFVCDEYDSFNDCGW